MNFKENVIYARESDTKSRILLSGNVRLSVVCVNRVLYAIIIKQFLKHLYVLYHCKFFLRILTLSFKWGEGAEGGWGADG